MLTTFYPKPVVDEVFDASEKFPVASVIMPRKVKTRTAKGGVTIEEGLWSFNSGIQHAQWDLLGILSMTIQGE